MPEKTSIYEEILLYAIDILYEEKYLLEEERTSMKRQIFSRQDRKDGSMTWRG